ncbi:MAG: hypothetical protein MJ239_03140 [Bacilli bacterium]|nr:hypothetical protein [Bacilli bacterium]
MKVSKIVISAISGAMLLSGFGLTNTNSNNSVKEGSLEAKGDCILNDGTFAVKRAADSGEIDDGQSSVTGNLPDIPTKSSLRLNYASAKAIYFSNGTHIWKDVVLHAYNESNPSGVAVTMKTTKGSEGKFYADISNIGFSATTINFTGIGDDSFDQGSAVGTVDIVLAEVGSNNNFFVTELDEESNKYSVNYTAVTPDNGDQYRVSNESIAFGFSGLETKVLKGKYDIAQVRIRVSVSYTNGSGEHTNYRDFCQDPTGKEKASAWAASGDGNAQTIQGAVVIPLSALANADAKTSFTAQISLFAKNGKEGDVSSSTQSVYTAATAYADPAKGFDKLYSDIGKAVLNKIGE